LTPELDRAIVQGAQKLGISKNAFVQITLAKALGDEMKRSSTAASMM